MSHSNNRSNCCACLFVMSFFGSDLFCGESSCNDTFFVTFDENCLVFCVCICSSACSKGKEMIVFFCLHVGICSDIIAWQVLLLLKLENPQAISQCVSDYVCIINWFQFILIQNHISLNFTSTFLQLPLHHPEWWMVFVHASFSKAVRSTESSEVCIVALRDRCRFVLQRCTEKLHDCIAAEERGSFLPWVPNLW